MNPHQRSRQQISGNDQSPNPDSEDLQVAEEEVILHMAGQAAIDRRTHHRERSRHFDQFDHESSNVTVGTGGTAAHPRITVRIPQSPQVIFSLPGNPCCLQPPSEQSGNSGSLSVNVQDEPSSALSYTSTPVEMLAEEKVIEHAARGSRGCAENCSEADEGTKDDSPLELTYPPAPHSTPIEKPTIVHFLRRASTDSMLAQAADTPKSALPLSPLHPVMHEVQE